MKFAAIGRHETLLKSIDALCAAGHELTYILTAREAPEYRCGVAHFEEKGRQLGVPVYVGSRIDANILNLIGNHRADVAISLNYPTVISNTAIDGFRFGILNAHGGDLPRYRGNACQAWAMINGEPHIGLCVHKMVGGELDSGDVIAKALLPIEVNTLMAQVMAWIEKKVPDLFVAALEKLSVDPEYVLYRQSDAAEPPLRCYPRRPSDAKVRWDRPSPEVVRLINASGRPYAGAFFDLEGQVFHVHRAEWIPCEAYCAVPGQIARINKDLSVDVACAGGGLCRVQEVIDAAGKVLMLGAAIKSVRARLE